jgi:N-methylhydantoinase A
MEAVDAALDVIAERLDVGRAEAARGVIRIANNNMINALKLVSVNRGHDPRDFTLVAFGGGGGMHAVELAAELGIRKIVIPRAADVFSAWGMLMSDLRRDYFVTRLLRLNAADAPKLNELLVEVADEALEQFTREGVSREQVRFIRYGSLRYENQEHSVELLLPDGTIDDASQAELADAFHRAYEQEYTYRLDASIEFVGLHLVALAEVGKLAPAPLAKTGRRVEEARKGQRVVDYAAGGVHDADIYNGELLEPGQRFVGPAVVETQGSTTVVHPGNTVEVDDYGNLIISFA